MLSLEAGATATEVALRTGWSIAHARDHLKAMVKRGEAAQVIDHDGGPVRFVVADEEDRRA